MTLLAYSPSMVIAPSPLRVALLALAALALGCGPDPLIIVRAGQVPEESPVLRVTQRWNGQDALPLRDFERARDAAMFTGDRAFFGLRARGRSGDLQLKLQALDADGCALARGDATRAVGQEDRVHVELDLLTLSPRTCPVHVDKDGDGEGTIEVGPDSVCGPACAAVDLDVPAGDARLSARAAPGSYFGGWSGACTGTAPCALTVKRPERLAARFVRSVDLRIRAGGPRWRAAGGLVASVDKADGVEVVVRCMEGDAAECVATRAFPLHVGRTVTLTVSPNNDSYFAGWEGACTGRGACILDMSQPQEVAAYFTSRVCGSERWCWDSPLPQGNDLSAVWMGRPDHGWAVGNAGIILHWDGHVWAQTYSGSSANLLSVWGRGESAWAVGEGDTILYWDGVTKKWTRQDNAYSGVVRGVWTAETGTDLSVWAVNEKGQVLVQRPDQMAPNRPTPWVRDATLPQLATPFPLNGIWGTGAGPIWIVGDKGLLYAYDPASRSWSEVKPGPGSTQDLLSVRGVQGDLWVAGKGGALFRRDGKDGVWRAVSVGTTLALSAVWGTRSDDVWIAGEEGLVRRFDGTGPVEVKGVVESPSALVSAAGVVADDFWLVGAGGLMLRHTAGGFVSPGRRGRTTLWDVWGSDSDHTWAVGSGGIIATGTNRSWNLRQEADQRLRAVWGTGAADIWAAGDNGTLLHFTGGIWGPVVSGTTAALLALHGTGPQDIWAAGESAILRFQGGTWMSRNTVGSVTLNGLYADQPGRAWGVGLGGAIYRWNDAVSRWDKQTNVDTRGLLRVSSPGGQEAWAVGMAGVVLRWQGTSWQPGTVDPLPANCANLWALSGAWAGGACGVLRHLEEGAWRDVESSGTTNVILGLWSSGDDVIAVGKNDMVLRRKK